MRYFQVAILIITTVVISCGFFQFKSGKQETIVNKQELIKFRIEIDEVESVARQGIKAKLYIHNIYHEKIKFHIPNCLRVAAPTVKYNNGNYVPIWVMMKEVYEPDWKELVPGGEFMVEFPYNLFEIYYLELGDEVLVQFSYYGEISDSQSKFLSGNDDIMNSNEIKIKMIEGKYR
jgi:hypothetical protein